MDDFDVRFHDTRQGRKIFRVMREGRAIFMGTKGECNRFMRLHSEKLKKELKALNTPRRRRPYVKRYRMSARRASSF